MLSQHGNVPHLICLKMMVELGSFYEGQRLGQDFPGEDLLATNYNGGLSQGNLLHHPSSLEPWSID
jgi:hypothetical protein